MPHITNFSEKKLNPAIRGTWYPNYDSDSFPNITLAAGQIAGITVWLASVGWAGAKAKGITHLYSGGGGSTTDERAWTELANIFSSRSDTITYGTEWIDGVETPKVYSIPNDTEAYNTGYSVGGNYTRFSVFTDEFCDGGSVIPPNAYYRVMRQFYRGFLARMGNPSPLNHNIFGGYMGWQNSITPGKFNMNGGRGYTYTPLDPYFVNGLSSQAAARKMVVYNDQTGAKDTSRDFDFFAYNLQDTLNLVSMCYNGMNEPDESHVAYSYINEWQRKYMGGIKKTIAFIALFSESVTLPVDTPGKLQEGGWMLKRPDSGDGDYFRLKDHHVTPTWTISFVSFMSQIIAHGWMIWDGERFSVTKDATRVTQNDFLQNSDAGRREQRFKWESPAGRPMPTLLSESTQPKHPFRPMSLMDVAIDTFAMVKIVEEFSAAGYYPTHLDYTTTYKDGQSAAVTQTVTAASGSKGKAMISKHVPDNYGQITMLQLADKRKGLCIGAETPGGRAWIYYFNAYRSPLQFDEETGGEFIIATLPSGRTVEVGYCGGRTERFIYF